MESFFKFLSQFCKLFYSLFMNTRCAFKSSGYATEGSFSCRMHRVKWKNIFHSYVEFSSNFSLDFRNFLANFVCSLYISTRYILKLPRYTNEGSFSCRMHKVKWKNIFHVEFFQIFLVISEFSSEFCMLVVYEHKLYFWTTRVCSCSSFPCQMQRYKGKNMFHSYMESYFKILSYFWKFSRKLYMSLSMTYVKIWFFW